MTMKSMMFNNNFLVSKDSLNRHGVSQFAEQKAMNFFSMIRDAVQTDKVRGDALISKQQNRLSITPENKRTSDVVESSQSSIEVLRRAFLAKGVSLDQVTLDQNDIKSLRLILDKFNFSPEDIDSFFRGTEENYSDKEMTLSDFFRDFTQFEADLKNTSSSHQAAQDTIFLDKASVPHIESALRDLGVTPEELDSLLPSVIDESGNVNMGKFMHQLKKMQSTPDSSSPAETGVENSSVLTPKLVEALNIMGLSSPTQSIGAPFSMDDLIGLMEAKGMGTDADVQQFDDQGSVVLDAVASISDEDGVEDEKINTFFAFAQEMMALQNFEKSYLGNARSPLIGSKATSNTNDSGGGVQKTVVAAKNGIVSPVLSDTNGTIKPDISDVRLEKHVETTTQSDIRNIWPGNRMGRQPVASSDKATPPLTPAAGAAVEMSQSGARVQTPGAVAAHAAIATGVEDLPSKVAKVASKVTSSTSGDIGINSSSGKPVDTPAPHVNTRVGEQPVASSDKATPPLTPAAGAAVEMSQSGARGQAPGAVAAHAAITPGVEDLSSKVAKVASKVTPSSAGNIGINSSSDRPVDTPAPHVNTRVGGQPVASSDKATPPLTPAAGAAVEMSQSGARGQTPGAATAHAAITPGVEDLSSKVAKVASKVTPSTKVTPSSAGDIGINSSSDRPVDTPAPHVNTRVGGQPVASSDKATPPLTPAAGAAVEMSQSGARVQTPGAATAHAAIAPGVEDLSSKVASKVTPSSAGDIGINSSSDKPVDTPAPHVNTRMGGQPVASSDKATPPLTPAVGASDKAMPSFAPADIPMEKASIISASKVMEMALPDQLLNIKDVLRDTKGFRKNIDSTFSLPWGKSDTSGGAQMIAAINGAAVGGKGGVSKEVDGLIDDILLGFGNRMEKMDKQGVHKNFHMDTSVGSEKFSMAGQGNTSSSTTEPLKPMTTLSDSQFPSNVIENVGKEISSFLQRGDRILKLQLKPHELGTVTIEMDTKENIVKLSVVAQTSAAKEMFLANHNDLRRVLEGHGVKLEGLNVQMNSNFDQSTANGNHNFSGQNQGANRPFSGIESVVDDLETQQVQPMRFNKDGLLDLLV